MRLAIVIPTLNEEATLERTLSRAVTVADLLVVADGGSVDRTCERARRCGALVVDSTPGRGQQLNLGARRALESRAEVLLFLHADTLLPPTARREIASAMAAGARGGGFLLRFDSARPLLRFGSRLVNLRTRWWRVPLGDQAQFVSAAAFVELGGFRDWPILEDLDFILRLRRAGRLAVVSDPVLTDARRFAHGGVLRTVATNWLIWLLFFSGVSAERLAGLYRHVR